MTLTLSSDSLRIAQRYAVLATLLHAAFITAALVPRWRAQPLVVGDAMSYLRPAQNLVQHGAFSRGSEPPLRWEAYRTPGYPFAIAATIVVFKDYRFVLYLAAVTAGLASFCAVSLGMQWGGRMAGHLAGIMTALWPNSLGLSGMLLTDAVVGHLTLVWFCLLHMTMTRADTRRAWLPLAAAITTMIALQALKPTFNAAFLLILAAAVIYRAIPRVWMMAGILGVSTFPLPTYFAERNLQDHGVFAPTLLDIETARNYLQARYEAGQTGLSYESVVTRFQRDDRVAADRLATPESHDGRLYLVRRQALAGFIRHAPWAIATLMGSEMIRQLVAPQEFASVIFRRSLSTVERVLWSGLTVMLLAFALLGAVRLVRTGLPEPALLAATLVVFFLLGGAISHYVSARLRFPADMVMIPVAAVGLAGMKRQPDDGVART